MAGLRGVAAASDHCVVYATSKRKEPMKLWTSPPLSCRTTQEADLWRTVQ